MRILLFLLGILAVIATALYLKFGNPFTAKHSKINPTIEQWNSILPGKWELIEVDSNYEEKWFLDIELEFLNDHSFKFSGTEKYFTITPGRNLYPMLVVGGGAEGKWQANGSYFGLNFQKCEFQISKNEENSENKILLLKCLRDSAETNFGAESSLIFKSEVKELNEDKIFITGKNYAKNYSFRRQFSRMKD